MSSILSFIGIAFLVTCVLYTIISSGIFIVEEYKERFTKYHYKGSLLHNETGPAISSFFKKEWYINNKRHRVDGPAVDSILSKKWFLNGKPHRTDGPSSIIKIAIFKKPTKQWWVDGHLHREDGPAVERDDGGMLWYKNGKKHRDDGPAIIHCDGYKEWWYDDKRVGVDTNEDFLRIMKLKLFI